jgi:hypothetical protein
MEYTYSKKNFYQSGWRDSNPRPPAPKAGALTKLRYIPLPAVSRARPAQLALGKCTGAAKAVETAKPAACSVWPWHRDRAL